MSDNHGNSAYAGVGRLGAEQPRRDENKDGPPIWGRKIFIRHD